MNDNDRFAITIGPVLYHWNRQTLMDFYAEMADSVADTLVLGEVVCSRRHELKTSDWLALAKDLAATGKEVVLGTQVLVESAADVRTLRRLVEEGELLVEAGDLSAVSVLTETGAPFVIGPHLNVYSRPGLTEYIRHGGMRWVAPVELGLDEVARIRAGEPTVPTEVFAQGRMPLAFSARCFTARHHRLTKDQCAFRCGEDPDGLLLSTSDGAPFLVLNGIQTQSAAQQCLIGEGDALRRAGVSRVRLSPSSRAFGQVVAAYDDVLNRGGDLEAALSMLQGLSLPGGPVDGFAHGQAGMAWSRA